MKIFTASRLAQIFTLVVALSCCTSISVQAGSGKWQSAATLPLLSSGHLLFADSLLGYYIGQDTGYVTKDGAKSWAQMTFPSEARPNPSFIYAPDNNTAILYQNGVDANNVSFPGIIKTTDQGLTWKLIATETARFPQNVKAFTMWSVNDGFRIWIDNVSQKDSCKVTHDGGITWNEKRGDATLEKYISKFTGSGKLNIKTAWSDSLHGAISVYVGAASSSTAYPVVTTSDGGRTWIETYPKFNGDATIPHSYVYTFPNSKTLWCLPSVLTKIEYYLYYSLDFGNTWNTTTPFKRNELFAYTKAGILELAPVSPTSSWAVLASDTEHPDLTKFIARHDLNTGWVRDTAFNYGGGKFGFSFNSMEIQFTDPAHGWAWATASAFVDDGMGGKKQVYIDSLFLFRFNDGAPTKGVAQSSKKPALRCLPNPASSSIKIEGFASDEIIKDLRVTNAIGIQFSPAIGNIGAGAELDVRNLPNGCYIVNVTTSLRTESVPVMVVH